MCVSHNQKTCSGNHNYKNHKKEKEKCVCANDIIMVFANIKKMRPWVYLLYINLSRLLQPFIKRADDGDFFRCLKAVCVTRVSRSRSRG
jgi:hypothetical protein